MTEYQPKYVGTTTKYVVIDSPTITPADLAIRAYELSQGALIKETCFGLMVTAETDELNRIVAELRKMDPCHIFVKTRGFPPGDTRRCRANLGGARPGFFGLEAEFLTIPYIAHGLENLEKTDAKSIEPPADPRKEKKLSMNTLKKMMDAQER
ncbi:MAG: methanogenesis marker 6 protein [Methanoregulaceae archaeon]